MSQVDMGSMLQQLQAIRSQLGLDDGSKPVKPAENDAVSGFGALLKQFTSDVAESQQQASVASTAFERGDPSVTLPKVMIDVQKANLSFNGLVQVRNKLVAAYQQIMDMQV